MLIFLVTLPKSVFSYFVVHKSI